MDTIFNALDAMENACESEEALLAYQSPDVVEVITAIRALTREQCLGLHGRLDHIRHVMEMNLALYGVETDRLKKQVHSLKAAQALHTPKVAVLHVNRA